MDSRQLIELAILAVVALLVLGRLYNVLGQKRGSERRSAPREPSPVPADAPRPYDPRPNVTPAPQPAVSGGVGEIMQVDASFDASKFLVGARAAYEMIVKAYADGDVETLSTLLTPRVHAAYSKAIADRAAAGGTGPELVRLRAAEIVDAGLNDDVAIVVVRFEAELAEGVHGIRDAKERWTFERKVRSRDPNWLLAGVAQA
jgi:predicted lipid-binding transport protein (Tim44 family)